MADRFLIVTAGLGVFIGVMHREPIFSHDNWADRAVAITYPTMDEALALVKGLPPKWRTMMGEYRIHPIEPNEGYYVTKAACIKAGHAWDKPVAPAAAEHFEAPLADITPAMATKLLSPEKPTTEAKP